MNICASFKTAERSPDRKHWHHMPCTATPEQPLERLRASSLRQMHPSRHTILRRKLPKVGDLICSQRHRSAESSPLPVSARYIYPKVDDAGYALQAFRIQPFYIANSTPRILFKESPGQQKRSQKQRVCLSKSESLPIRGRLSTYRSDSFEVHQNLGAKADARDAHVRRSLKFRSHLRTHGRARALHDTHSPQIGNTGSSSLSYCACRLPGA